MTEIKVRATRLYPVAVGLLVFAAGLTLNLLHIAEHSVWRAVLVGGVSAALVYWVGPRLVGAARRRPDAG